MKKFLIFIFLFPLIAHAQSLQCAPRSEIIQHFQDVAKAEQIFIGFDNEEHQNSAIEIWKDTVHPDREWAAIITHKGISCLLGGGLGWESPMDADHGAPPVGAK